MGHKPYLGAILEKDARVLTFAPPQLTLALPEGGLRSPQEILPVLQDELKAMTGQPWVVTLAPYAAAQGATLKEEKNRAYEEKLAKIGQEDDVQKILQAFPGARITQMTETER